MFKNHYKEMQFLNHQKYKTRNKFVADIKYRNPTLVVT